MKTNSYLISDTRLYKSYQINYQNSLILYFHNNLNSIITMKSFVCLFSLLAVSSASVLPIRYVIQINLHVNVLKQKTFNVKSSDSILHVENIV